MVCGKELKGALSRYFQKEWHQITYGMVGDITDQAIDQFDVVPGVKTRVRSLRKVVQCFRPHADNLDKIRLELTCPISLDIAKNPVVIPCCGRVLERKEACKLHAEQRFDFYTTCPCCRGRVLSNWLNDQPKRSAILNISTLLQERLEG